MKKNVLLIIFCFTLFVLNTQGQILKKLTNGISDVIETGKVKTIYKEIKDQDFLKANEKLEEFKVKYPSNKTIFYLSYLINSSQSSKFINYDLAYKSISKLLDEYYYKMDKDERESYCKDIEFCEDNLKREYDQIQLKLLNTNNNDENSITQFINNYPKSKYLDSAVRIRHQIRYKKAITQNTIDSYSDFINKNPYARQRKEAEYNLRILAFKEAEWKNTAASYEYFIRNYSGENILDKRALSRIKYIRYKKIIDDYEAMKNQTGRLIDDFTKETFSNFSIYNTKQNEFQIQYSSSKYFGKGEISLDQNKIKESYIKADNSFYNSKIFIDPILNDIYQFTSLYSESPESLVLQNMKKELEELKAKIDYFLVSGTLASEKSYQAFIETYPKSTYSIILKSKILEIKNSQMKKEEFAKKQRINAEEKYRVEQEKIQKQAEEEKKKKNQENSMLYQVLKQLSPADQKLLTSILEGKVDTDPKGIAGNICGSGYGSCKWCGKAVTYKKVYVSRVQTLSMYAFMSPLTDALMPIVDIYQSLGGLVTGAQPQKSSRDQIVKGLIIEIQANLKNIRSGNYYKCENASGDLFCSLRCQSEYKYNR